MKLLAFNDGDGARFFQQVPGPVVVDPYLARINDLSRFDLFIPKKLLGIFAGGSAFAQVSPFDIHLDSPWFDLIPAR